VTLSVGEDFLITLFATSSTYIEVDSLGSETEMDHQEKLNNIGKGLEKLCVDCPHEAALCWDIGGTTRETQEQRCILALSQIDIRNSRGIEPRQAALCGNSDIGALNTG